MAVFYSCPKNLLGSKFKGNKVVNYIGGDVRTVYN